MNFEWNVGVPDLARGAAEPILAAYAALIPSWCTLRVLWGGEKEGCPAEINVNFEYRNAQLILFKDFLASPPELREEYVLHELLHIPLMAMKSTFSDLVYALNLYEEKPELHRWATEAMRQANEGATQDLTDALLRWRAAS